jgi:hypothetical protein
MSVYAKIGSIGDLRSLQNLGGKYYCSHPAAVLEWFMGKMGIWFGELGLAVWVERNL